MTAAPQAAPHCAVCGTPVASDAAALPVVRAVAPGGPGRAACSAGTGCG